MRLTTFGSRLCTLLILGALSACGGGGGDSGGGGGGGGGTSGSLSLSVSTMNFSTNSLGLVPQAQNVTATVTTNATIQTLFLRVVISGPAVANVANISVTGTNSGQGTVIPANPQVLGPGTFTSTITVTACTTSVDCTSGVIGTPQTINVTYTVNGVTSAPTVLAYTLGMTTVPADYTRTLSVTASPSFTASTNVAWLSVAPTSGNGTTQLTVSLAQATVDAFDSGNQTAQVTITTPSSGQLVIPVTLTVTKPQLDQVTPYIATTNIGGTVILRGQFLDLIRQPMTPGAIEFAPSTAVAGVPASAIIVMSPTELRVTYPPLAAGQQLVLMRSTQGALIDRSNARMFVADAPAYASGVLPYPTAPSNKILTGLVYDAERQALLVGIHVPNLGFDNNELYRYVNTGTWSAGAQTAIPSLDSLALTADGQQLLTGSESNPLQQPLIEQRDPSTLVVLTSATGTNTSAQTLSSLAVTSDGDVLAMGDSHSLSGNFTLFRYTPRTNVLQPLPNGFAHGIVAASGDGGEALAASDAGGSGNQTIYEYSASTGTLAPWSNLQFDVRELQLDRMGANALINKTEVWDPNTFTMKGELPATTSASVLTPDGTTAYTYGTDGQVHRFDISALPPGGLGGAYPEVGTPIALADDPSAAPGDLGVWMLVTPDGGTLFLAGSQQVVVQSLP
jgi:hypothetical protein